MLAREGLVMNHKKLLRLYREENLRVRRRRGRKRAMGTRAMTLPQGPNQRWSLDFVSDTLISGRRIRILAVVDDFTRECLALVADTRSEEHTSELQSLMRISYAVFCLEKKTIETQLTNTHIFSSHQLANNKYKQT